MAQELKEANKRFKKWWKKDLKHIKKVTDKNFTLTLLNSICYAFYLRGWTDSGTNIDETGVIGEK